MGLNDDPADEGEQDVETFYNALHDVNFNVMALVTPDLGGDMVERYEYTPHGQRRVYRSGGDNDPLALNPRLISDRFVVSSVSHVTEPFIIRVSEPESLRVVSPCPA